MTKRQKKLGGKYFLVNLQVVSVTKNLCDLEPFTSLQNVRHSCGEVLFLVYLQAASLQIAKSNTSPYVLLTF